jgi:sugar phosphate isomerase/epimerase
MKYETTIDKQVGRRDFLRSTAAAALLSAVPAAVMRGAQDRSASTKTKRLACNSWPFRGYFDTPAMHEFRDLQLPLLTQADFPQFLADHFNIHNVEFLPQHFVDTDPSTIDKVKAGLKKANSRCCNLMGVEIPGGVFTPQANPQTMQQAAQRWIDVAVALGSPSVTVALNGKESADPHTAAKNLVPFVDIAQRRGIKVLFHNDSLESESAEILTSVIKQLGAAKTGTCPDFGNFATKSAAFALEQLRMLAPYASNICHSKDGIADGGKFYADDFGASMKMMRESGFKGLYSLEFEGIGTALDGVQKLMNLTEQYLD